jgi:very-short-patch-repair endonuclease
MCEQRFHDRKPIREYIGGVPNRRFRIDIAFVSEKIAIEIDGWQYHAKFKDDFIKDRERQNLFVMNGWRILRFTASQIIHRSHEVESMIAQALSEIRSV